MTEPPSEPDQGTTALPAGPAPTQQVRLPMSVPLVTAALATASLALATGPVEPMAVDGDDYLVLGAFGALFILAQSLFIRIRYRGQVNALNLVEAVLAPLIFAFPGVPAIVVVVMAQAVGELARRIEPVKLTFNVVQWSLATGAGTLAFQITRHGGGVTARNLVALVVALMCVGLVNQLTFAVVITLVDRHPLLSGVVSIASLNLPAWAVGWILNSLFGVLFVMAYASGRGALLLFIVPLIVLHAAYRGYAGARSDRVRLAGLHRASSVLASPLDPNEAIAAFLAEVGTCFEAAAVELIFNLDDAIMSHSVRASDPTTYARGVERVDEPDLRAQLVHIEHATRVTRGANTDIAKALTAAGWHDCLVAPLVSDQLPRGALVVFDQAGLEGFEEGERAVLEALARETAGIFEKGTLFSAVIQERTKLAQILDSTSDGIFTVTSDGTVRSWNPGIASITGYSAVSMIGRSALDLLRARDDEGRPVSFSNWQPHRLPPESLQFTDQSGSVHWLACSYSPSMDEDVNQPMLVVIARDTTKTREIEQLKEDVGRLTQLEATQRARVLQLQDSLRPPIPTVSDTEFGVHYLPSDSSAPTGGDLYDWQLLADGSLHLSIVDVLGSGVAATKDALTVTHTLRQLAQQGTSLGRIVAFANDLVLQSSPDLVATAIVARYEPESGLMEVAGAGHPPAFLVRASGVVEEVTAPGIPLGWPGAGSDEVVTVRLEEGDSLILYTDGLVEARRDIVEGMAALARTAAETREFPVQRVARTLVERALAGAERRDDSLAVVVRRTMGYVAEERVPDLIFDFTTEPHNVGDARRKFLTWAEQVGVSESICSDLGVVISELVTNAIRAARARVEVRASAGGRMVMLEVEDDGFGIEDVSASPTVPMPPEDSERGRGLHMVRALADEVSIIATQRGTIISCVKADPGFEARRYQMPAAAAH